MKRPRRGHIDALPMVSDRLVLATGSPRISAKTMGRRLLLGRRLCLRVVLMGLVVVGWASLALAGVESAGAGPVEGLNPLESWKADLALWTAVVFLVLLVVLWKYAWGPIVRALQQREQTIADQIAQAHQQHQEAQNLLAQYQQKLAQSQAEVQQMLEDARRQAEQTGRQIIQQAHQQAEKDREKMLQEIQRAKQQALRELSAEAAALAVHLAGKILQTELRPERHRQLIRQTLAQWEAAASSVSSARTGGGASTDREDPRR